MSAALPAWAVTVGRDWTTPAVGSLIAVQERGRVVAVVVTGVCEHVGSVRPGPLDPGLFTPGDYAELGPVVVYRHRSGACGQCADHAGGQHVTRAGLMVTWAPAPDAAGALF